MHPIDKLLIVEGGYHFRDHIKFMEMIQGDQNFEWEFDTDNALLHIQSYKNGHLEEFYYHVQILGTVDENTNHWIWIWDHKYEHFPDHLKIYANEVRDYGKKYNIPIFVQSSIQLSEKLPAHLIALLSTCICKSQTFLFCEYEEGLVCFVINDERLPKFSTQNTIDEFAQIFIKYIETYSIVDHMASCAAYLYKLQIPFQIRRKGLFNRKDYLLIKINKFIFKATFDRHMKFESFNMIS